MLIIKPSNYCGNFSDTKPPTDLESCFFDLEVEMERDLCRDRVCMCEDSERREFLVLLWKVVVYSSHSTLRNLNTKNFLKVYQNLMYFCIQSYRKR